jgi:hypothetical protein
MLHALWFLFHPVLKLSSDMTPRKSPIQQFLLFLLCNAMNPTQSQTPSPPSILVAHSQNPPDVMKKKQHTQSQPKDKKNSTHTPNWKQRTLSKRYQKIHPITQTSPKTRPQRNSRKKNNLKKQIYKGKI